MHAGENKYQIVQRGDYNMNEEYRISTHIITHEGQSPDYNDQETITKLTEIMNGCMNKLLEGIKAKYPNKSVQIISHSISLLENYEFLLSLLFRLDSLNNHPKQ